MHWENVGEIQIESTKQVLYIILHLLWS